MKMLQNKGPRMEPWGIPVEYDTNTKSTILIPRFQNKADYAS